MSSFRLSVGLLHLSRLPNQELPNYGQQVSTLRICNFDVKSRWRQLGRFFPNFLKLGCLALVFLEDTGQGLLSAAKDRELIPDEGVKKGTLVFDLDVV